VIISFPCDLSLYCTAGQEAAKLKKAMLRRWCTTKATPGHGTGLGASQSGAKYDYSTETASPLAAHCQSCCLQHVSKLMLKSAAADPL